MKKVLIILLTIFVSTIASGRCYPRGVYCLNYSKSLNKNGLIILMFHDESRAMIPELNLKYPIFLKSSIGNVQLNVIETLIGDYLETQIVLKPAYELHESEIYTLQIDNLPKYEKKLERYNSVEKMFEPIYFIINDNIDNQSPVFSSVPVWNKKKKRLTNYSGFPTTYSFFKLSGHDDSELFVRTRVRNKSTGHITTYILDYSNEVSVGHAMCGGPFEFENGDLFEVYFQLFDQSGNKSAWTKAVSFTKPKSEYYGKI